MVLSELRTEHGDGRGSEVLVVASAGDGAKVTTSTGILPDTREMNR